MSNFTRKQIEEAIDKYQMDHPLFAPMMYDVTSLPDIESTDFITKEIRKCQDKIAEDTEMYLICEMAKMYMQGVVPHYEVRRTGEWVDEGIRGYVCSACGDRLPYSDEYDYQTNYCPNCGAEMRKGGAEE